MLYIPPNLGNVHTLCSILWQLEINITRYSHKDLRRTDLVDCSSTPDTSDPRLSFDESL